MPAALKRRAKTRNAATDFVSYASEGPAVFARNDAVARIGGTDRFSGGAPLA